MKKQKYIYGIKMGKGEGSGEGWGEGEGQGNGEGMGAGEWKHGLFGCMGNGGNCKSFYKYLQWYDIKEFFRCNI